MSRHLPDKNRTKSTHADTPEREEDNAKVDTFSHHDHQRRRGHVQGRNRNRPHLLSVRRMSEGFYRERRENQTHAHARLMVHLKIRLSSCKIDLRKISKKLNTRRFGNKTTGNEIEVSR